MVITYKSRGKYIYDIKCRATLCDLLILFIHSFLKVPKREIFDRSDFPGFYTVKSLRVGDFGVKIKKFLKIFRGAFRGAKFLTRMLSLFLRRFFF